MARLYQTFDEHLEASVNPKSYDSATAVAPLSVAMPDSGSLGQTGAQGQEPSRFVNLGRELAGARGEASSLSGDFTREAGPSRTYDSIGGSEAVRGFVEEGANEQKVADALRARYEGPTTLDTARLGKIRDIYGNLKDTASTLTGGAGAIDWVRSKSPGLTLGEARFEAKENVRDPEYRREVAAMRGDISAGAQELENRRKAAEAYALQRTSEESSIAEKTRNALGTAKSGLLEQLQAKVAERKAQNDALRGRYDQFLESGDPSVIQGDIPGWYEHQFGDSLLGRAFDENDPGRSAFDSNIARDRAAAESEYERIMAQFPEIADVPLMEAGINSHGREVLKPNSEWWHEAKKNLKGKWRKTVLDMLRERQIALENAGFAYGTTRTNTKEAAGDPAGAGKYAPYMPLYVGGEDFGEFESPDPRLYTQFDPGVSPTIENMATDKQAEQFNRISAMLDEAERLDAAAEAPRAAQILADIDGYLSREESELEKRKETLSANQKAWKNTVQKARSRYRRAKKKAQALSSITSLGTESFTGSAGLDLGKIGAIGGLV